MAGAAGRGRYEAREHLGRGGMGEVYRALDRVTGTEVALKMLRSEHLQDAHHGRRLEREFDALRRVVHRNVVQVFDCGRHHGAFYFTMEYVPGSNLAKRLEQGPMAPAEAATLVAEVADGLLAVHEAGILHRDVKPENVLLDRTGTPKLCDFGLATLQAPLDSTRLTGDGQFVGTFRYLPPEVLGGHGHDERSEVYQLGLVLYSALTGVHPFADAPLTEVLRAEAHARLLPPSSREPDLDPALDALVMAALRADPAERLATVAELRDGLWAWLEGQPGTVRSHRTYSGRFRAYVPPPEPSAWTRLAGRLIGGVAFAARAARAAWAAFAAFALSLPRQPRAVAARLLSPASSRVSAAPAVQTQTEG